MNRNEKRAFPPSHLWLPISKILTNHYNHYHETGNTAEWNKSREKWNMICSNLIDQQSGKILGTLEVFDHLKFCERLAVDDDRFIRLAASLLCRPVHDDIMFCDGFYPAIEDILLKKYHIAPNMSRLSGNVVSVRLPKLIDRIVCGYPSPWQIQRDFQRMTHDIWSVNFSCVVKHRGIIFSFYYSPVDRTGMDPAFVKEGLSLMESARCGA